MKLSLLLSSVLVLVSSALIFVSCTTTPTQPIGCSIEKVVSGALAASIGSTLQCSHLDVIQSDIERSLGSANLCQAQEVQLRAHKGQSLKNKSKTYKGIIGNIVCPIAVDSTMELFGTKIPPTWGCTLDKTSNIRAILITACTTVVPI